MARKASGEIKTKTVRSRQKNGDIYVLERKTLYDPKTQYNKVLSTRLIGKIPKGSTEMVPTRPKKADSKKQRQIEDGDNGAQAAAAAALSASRTRVGMMGIIDHIGKASGIDDALYAATDTGTAQKAISLARYLLATGGASLPGILTWQYNHPLPYEEGLSEDIYHELFHSIGLDETLQQNFFLSRCARLGDGSAIAYDSTTLPTYSENQLEARYGFNKGGDGLKTIKYLTLYSIDTRQPIAFTRQPGNLPDVITIGNALKQLQALGVPRAELVTDNGYLSEQNLAELLLERFSFITLARVQLKWIRPELERHGAGFRQTSTACPFDASTHGVTSVLMREFTRVRKYASKKAGLSAGDKETFSRRVYLHIYFNATRRAEEDSSFDGDLVSIKALLEGSEPLSEAAQKKAGRYLVVKTRGGKVSVSFNEKAIDEAKRYHGYFALVSNSEKDAFSALAKYRKREYIEGYFRAAKQKADSTRVRVWDADTLRGRMFVQFVSLCYYEHLSEEIRKMKLSLGRKTGDAVHDTKARLDLEKKLKGWLGNTPLYLQLQWFDVIEGVEVSSKLKSRRWSTEVTKRDALYLEKLGVSGVL
jgi:hypothetical protein